jgi:hypothetical protein
MLKYTIISFNFNGYDKLREPLFCDPNAKYIYITDHKIESKNWKVIIDPKLVNKNPIYSSYYVRYHPFEYANTDIVIVVDASVQIKDSLEDIVNEFEKYNSDIAPMCTNYPNDENKINFWIEKRQSLITEDADKIKQFINPNNIKEIIREENKNNCDDIVKEKYGIKKLVNSNSANIFQPKNPMNEHHKELKSINNHFNINNTHVFKSRNWWIQE